MVRVRARQCTAFLILLLLTFCDLSNAANILCVFTCNGASHLIVHMSYARALADRGHNVTVVTTLPLTDKNPPFHHIFIRPTDARINQINEVRSEMTKTRNFLDLIKREVKTLMAFGPIQYEALKDPRFQDFMHNPDNKFDLLMIGYFISDYLLGLGVHFKCPVVVSWMSSPNIIVNQYVGNPSELAYVPVAPPLGELNLLTFRGRVVNFLASIFVRMLEALMDFQMEGFYNDLFPAPDYVSLKEARKRVSLLLCNSHFSEGMVRPNVPSLIEVGGIQVKDNPDTLPRDLQQIFDDSQEHGVVYLSFGSFIESEDVDPKILNIIFEVLSNLNQTVIWKWEGRIKSKSSPNIYYKTWVPQDDILAHPNLRLFITHAGKGSVAESQYHGVPMVAIPLFADQPGNADQLVKNGFGLLIDRHNVTNESLRANILAVLKNPKYKENVQRFSKLYKDRPKSARDTAVYWIEYVIRHKGAYHMQSPFVHLNFLQTCSADVIGFILLLVYIVCKGIRILGRYGLCKIFRLNSTQRKKPKIG